MAKAQEWLDKKYSNKTKITEILTPLFKDLEGELRVEGFAKLEKLVCRKNRLVSLKISGCPNLAVIDCSDNLLTHFELVAENPEKVVSINITNNNLGEQTLSSFSQFSNLRELYLGTTSRERVEKKIYNRFFGSLKPLQNLNNLQELGISNTDIGLGLEFVPDNLQRIYCASQREGAGCQKIQEQLWSNFGKLTNYYDLVTNKKGDSVSLKSSFSSGSLNSFSQLIGNKPKSKKTPLTIPHEQATNEMVEMVEEGGHEQAHQLKSQLTELNSIVCPNESFDFMKLKTEIQKLKIKELVPQLQEKKVQLTGLIATLQDKTGKDLQAIINLLLQTQKKMITEEQEDNKISQGQLVAYQDILQTKLSQEELLNLTNLQKEVFYLEKQLINLGYQELQIQQEIPPK